MPVAHIFFFLNGTAVRNGAMKLNCTPLSGLSLSLFLFHTHTPSPCPSVLPGASIINDKTVLWTGALKAWKSNFLGQSIKRQKFAKNIYSYPFGGESKLISVWIVEDILFFSTLFYLFLPKFLFLQT